MKKPLSLIRSVPLLGFLLVADQLSAQSSSTGSSYVMYMLIGLGVILAAAAIMSVSENLMQIEAQKSGVDTTKNNFSIIPNFSELFGKPAPEYTVGAQVHQFNKGHDILLAGEADPSVIKHVDVSSFALRPVNFRELSPIPRMLVKAGQEVHAGEPLFEDKKDDRVKYVSPVSGEVAEIRRGDKRAITDVIILADKAQRSVKHDVSNLMNATRDDIVAFFLKSGAWSHLNQRPYDVIPDPDVIPNNIFISTFDTAPLAIDYNVVVQGKAEVLQAAVNVLAKLTSGKVHIGLSADKETAPATEFLGLTGVQKSWYKGAHPAGNVGVHIHHTAPINATSVVWTIGIQDLLTIGQLCLTGEYNAERVVVIAGDQVSEPQYVKTYSGAKISDLLRGNLKGDHNRIIAGDVLTGKKQADDAYLGIHDDQVTVIKEGDDYEMFGWLVPIKPRPSISNTFPNFLYPNHRFEVDTNTHGERRAFVVTGQYEAVLPMDIYVQQLMKSIMANDYERMEGLGIAELSEEDVAICEFVCTSKMPLQKILRDGLNMMREQG